MKPNRPWMPFYVVDFETDTVHLDAIQTGAYVMLILHYWKAGKLPSDDRSLARIARCDAEQWCAMRPIIEAFFAPGWRHKRIDFELGRAVEKSTWRAEAGRKGGLAKECNYKLNVAMLQHHLTRTEQNRTEPRGLSDKEEI
jgi:uncharacterized protein YdaU (DUF1376 family)